MVSKEETIGTIIRWILLVAWIVSIWFGWVWTLYLAVTILMIGHEVRQLIANREHTGSIFMNNWKCR